MLSSFLVVTASVVLIGADLQFQPGTQLAYRGVVRPKSNPEQVLKSFDLKLFVVDASAGARRVRWLLDETGRGGWAWSERFGEVALNAELRWDDATAPALRFDHGGEGTSIVPLPPMFLAPGTELAADARWSTDGWEFRVLQKTEQANRLAWQIEVRNAFGPKRTVWLDVDSKAVVGLNERFFMGMGEEHELQLRLASCEQLPPVDFAKLSAGLEALLDLRARMGRPPRSETTQWNPTQLALLKDQVPALRQLIANGPLADVFEELETDVQVQSERISSVAVLAAQRVGKPAPKFGAAGLDGSGLSDAALLGQTTVLHFWEYRDAPLTEPYGQVGYLDFLYNRYKERGVAVYGVAVDGRLAHAEERAAAARGVRKFRGFMNIGYSQLLDGGQMIEGFGDPRVAGASLPLFVVIGPDGKIVHYHAGYYDIDRDQGLKELEAAIVTALGNSQ